MIHSYSPSKVCVDDYFCTTSKTATLRQILLGPLSLILLLTSLVANIFIVSILGHRRLRSASNSYLSTAIIADTLQSVIFLVGIVIPSMSGNPNNQFLVYETIVAYLVPIGEPFGHMLRLLTGLCLISATVIRICSHLKHRTQLLQIEQGYSSPNLDHPAFRVSEHSITRRLHLLAAITIILLVSAPTIIRYKVVETEKHGRVYVRVFYTALMWSHGWNLYDTVLLAITTLILILLIIALFIVTRKWKIKYVPGMQGCRRRSTSCMAMRNRSFCGRPAMDDCMPMHAPCNNVCPPPRPNKEALLILKRIKMEIRLIFVLSFFWTVPALGYTMLKLISSMHGINQKSKVVQEQFLTMKIAVDFVQIFMLFLRTVGCLTSGVLIRRVLLNMLCLWRDPKKYPSIKYRGDEVLLDPISNLFKNNNNNMINNHCNNRCIRMNNLCVNHHSHHQRDQHSDMLNRINFC